MVVSRLRSTTSQILAISMRFVPTVACAWIAMTAPAMSESASDKNTEEAPFFLGIQTHFAQGWQLHYLNLLPDIGTMNIRDDANWTYFAEGDAASVSRQESPVIQKMDTFGAIPLIVFPGSTPNEDQGQAVYSDQGREALAGFVSRVLAAHPETIKRIEIGNELNSPELGAAYTEDAAFYSALLISKVASVARETRPDIEILCTGAHSVATGYLRDLFESGALQHCDAISFHPYRGEPENVDIEIRRLRALVDEFGGNHKLYVTEFGKWFKDPEEAPDYMLKMVSLMGAAGVSGAYWYSLLNEDLWPNMGLFFPNGQEMPAVASFRFLQSSLLPLGRPVARGTKGKHHIYEFGTGGRAFVVWGAPGQLIVNGAASFFDSAGNPVEPLTEVSSKPVVILGKKLEISVQRDREIYSAFWGYGMAPWTYFAKRPDGEEVPFGIMDGNWDPYIGHRHLNPMKITTTSVDAAMFNDEAYYSVERFVVPEDGFYDIAAQWNQPEPDTDGADIRISLNGVSLATGVANAVPFEWSAPALELVEGDRLDFAVGPNQRAGIDWVDRQISIVGP